MHPINIFVNCFKEEEMSTFHENVYTLRYRFNFDARAVSAFLDQITTVKTRISAFLQLMLLSLDKAFSDNSKYDYV